MDASQFTPNFTQLNFEDKKSAKTINAVGRMKETARMAKEVASSQTHTDENWVHTTKGNVKKVAAVASLGIVSLHMDKVKDGGLKYCNLSKEHLQEANINPGSLNLTTQAGVNDCINRVAEFDKSCIESLKKSNTFVKDYFDNKGDLGSIVSDYNHIVGKSGNSEAFKDFLAKNSNYLSSKGCNAKIDDIIAGCKAINNQQNSAKALATVSSKATTGMTAKGAVIAHYKSYGRRIITQSMMDDDMKRGYNITASIARPAITTAKLTARASIKGAVESSKQMSSILEHRSKKIAEQLTDELKLNNIKRYSKLEKRSLDLHKKAESLNKNTRAFYNNYENLRGRKNALKRGDLKRAFETKARNERKLKSVVNTQGKKQAKVDKFASKNIDKLNRRYGEKARKKLTSKISEKIRQRTLRFAERTAKFADKAAKAGKLGGAIGALVKKIGEGVAAIGAAIGGEGVGGVLLAILGVLLMLVIVIVCAGAIIILVSYYAIHFASDGTNFQEELDSLNYCQAIANAVTYDIGAEYTFIVKNNTERQFLDTVYIGKYGLPCTPQVTSTYDKSFVWEETDNTTKWANGELIFKDNYIANASKRNTVDSNANIIPIMNMMHSKMLEEIGYEEWPTALAYCYYMYAASHSLSQYDSNANTTGYITIKNDDGTPTGYKLVQSAAGAKQKGADNTIFYCSGDMCYPNVQYAQIDENGDYIPMTIGKNKVDAHVSFTNECNNIYFHDEYDNILEEIPLYNNPNIAALAIQMRRYLGTDVVKDNYECVQIFQGLIYPNRKDGGRYQELYEVLIRSASLNDDTAEAIANIDLGNKTVHFFDLDRNNANDLQIAVSTEQTYKHMNGVQVINNGTVINDNVVDMSWYKDAQCHCDSYMTIPYYTHDRPFGATHPETTIRIETHWEYQEIEITHPGPGGYPVTEKIRDQYQVVEEIEETIDVPNDPAGYVGVCKGHCAGHIRPVADIVTMMTYEGLAQLDNFKTTHFLTVKDVVGNDFYSNVILSGTSDALSKTYTDLGITNEAFNRILTSYASRVADGTEINALAMLLLLHEPYINDSNYKQVLNARYEMLEDDSVSLSAWKLYWVTLSEKWFSPFPQSYGGFMKYVSKKTLYYMAGLIDNITAKVFPALVKMASGLGISDTDINNQNEISTVDDGQEDMYGFEGWILPGKCEYNSGEIDVLKSFYGDYYEDAYEMSLEAWDGFEVEFNLGPIKRPQYIPTGNGNAEENPQYRLQGSRLQFHYNAPRFQGH